MASPEKTLKIGVVRCAIYKHKNKDDVTWYSVSVRREYDKGGGMLQESGSFGINDLLVVGEITRQAFLWINEALDVEKAGNA